MKTSKLKGIIGLLLFAASFFIGYAFDNPNDGIALATLINVGTLTWNGKEVMDMAGAIMESTFQNPQLTSLHTIVDGIVAKQQIVYLGRLSKISRKDAGCDPTDLSKTITTSEKFWLPELCSFRVPLCAKDLAESFFIWGQKNGLSRADLSGTEAAKFVMQRIEEALVEDALRIAWFNHTDAANVDDSPAGILTSGIDVEDYDIIDGFWAQIYDIVTADADRNTAISENANGSYATQLALAADKAYDTFKAMTEDCDKRLKGAANKVIICTDTLVDNYMTTLESSPNDLSFARIQDANLPSWDTGLRFRGIPIYKFDFWDRTIQEDFDNGTKYYQPHRALLTTIDNLQIGVDSQAAIDSVVQFYDPVSRKNYWDGMYKIDVKVVEDFMIQAAY